MPRSLLTHKNEKKKTAKLSNVIFYLLLFGNHNTRKLVWEQVKVCVSMFLIATKPNIINNKSLPAQHTAQLLNETNSGRELFFTSPALPSLFSVHVNHTKLFIIK